MHQKNICVHLQILFLEMGVCETTVGPHHAGCGKQSGLSPPTCLVISQAQLQKRYPYYTHITYICICIRRFLTVRS